MMIVRFVSRVVRNAIEKKFKFEFEVTLLKLSRFSATGFQPLVFGTAADC